MSAFKDQIETDNQTVFVNTDEFADMHCIDGEIMPCMIDNNEMIDRERRYNNKRDLYADGIYKKELLIYVRASDFGTLPAIGRVMMFDKKQYLVADAIDEQGIYSITLTANRSGVGSR